MKKKIQLYSKEVTLFRNGKVVTPQGVLQTDFLVKNGHIHKIMPDYAGHVDEEIDCKGLVIMPGMIDTHVHFRDPGLTEKEDFESGTRASLSGGVTTIMDMPNTLPPVTKQAELRSKHRIAESKSHVFYDLYAVLTRENFSALNRIPSLAGIKIFFGSSTGNLLVNDLPYLSKVFRESRHLLAIHAEDEHMIKTKAQEHAGESAPEVHSKIRPREAEIEAIETILKLAKKNPQARIHLCHVSTKESVELLRKFKLKNVTAEVSMHHLLLNEEAYERLGNFAKVNPPLRTKQDNASLLEALKDGTIQTIATDHAPHLVEEKERDYADAPSGMPMVELTLPLLLDLYHQKKVTLEEISRWTAENPSKIWKIRKHGGLRIGYSADFNLVDLEKTQTVKKANLESKCKWSPFDGKELQGKIVATYLRGKKVYANGKLIPKNGLQTNKRLHYYF